MNRDAARAFLLRRWPWLLLGTALLGWMVASQGVRDYFVRRREYGRLEAKVREARARVAEKRALLVRAAKDDSFLETEARRTLGLVRSDEVEFRFVPSTAAAGAEERMERVAPGGR